MSKDKDFQRYKRLIESRTQSSTVSRSQAQSFRKSSQHEAAKSIFQRQQEEMKNVEDQLKRMRHEYNRVCKERGRAHVSAKLIEQQEQEIADFERRRDELVRTRAQEVARREAKKVIVQNELKREAKLKSLENRKKLLATDWTSPPPESSQYWQELQSLTQLEEALQKEVESKRKRHVSCQVSLSDSSSSSADTAFSSQDSTESFQECCMDELVARVLSRIRCLQQAQKPKELHRREQTEIKKVFSSQSSVRTQDKRFSGDQQEKQQKKVLKDVAINTSLLRRVDVIPDDQEGTSSNTSYKSLPKEVTAHRNVEEALEQMAKELSGRAVSTSNRGLRSSGQRRQPLREANNSAVSVEVIDNRDRNISGFWQRVFKAAGVPLNDSTMMLIQDLDDSNVQNVSLSGLSISSKTMVASPRKHSTPFSSSNSSPAKSTS